MCQIVTIIVAFFVIMCISTIFIPIIGVTDKLCLNVGCTAFNFHVEIVSLESFPQILENREYISSYGNNLEIDLKKFTLSKLLPFLQICRNAPLSVFTRSK